MVEKYPAVYIVANRYRGTIYVGVTSVLLPTESLPRAIWPF